MISTIRVARVRLARTAVLILPLVLAMGCGGGGQIELVSLDYKNIEPQRPLVQRFALDDCRWWTDADGTLWLTMTRKTPLLFGPVRELDFQFSLRLDKLPAGVAKNYTVAADSLRARVKLGPAEARFTSVGGIGVVERKGEDRLTGVFRIPLNRHTVQLLGGWTRGPRALLLARIEAVRDAGGGREIVALTESAGFDRTPMPASAPANPDRALSTIRTERGEE